MRRALLWALALGSTLVFGYFAVRGVDLAEVKDAFAEANLWWFVPSLAVLAVAVFIRAVRWQSLFEPATRPPIGPVTSSMLVGVAVNNIFPFRAGEAARIVALNRSAGTAKVESLATVALERILDVFCLLVLLFVALPVLPDVSWLGAAAVLAGVLVLVLASGAFVIAIWGERPLHALARLAGRLPFVSEEHVEHAGHSLTRGFVGLRHPKTAFWGFTWTTLSWIVTSFSFWIATLAFDLDVPLSAGILILAAVGLSLVLPAAPGALGVFEAAVVLALSAYDVPRAEAVSFAFALHALNFFPYLLSGVIALRFTRPSR